MLSTYKQLVRLQKDLSDNIKFREENTPAENKGIPLCKKLLTTVITAVKKFPMVGS